MSGIEEAALAAWIANAAADSALVYGGLAAGEGTAAAALGSGALSGGLGALTAGTAMGGGALTEADIAMAQAMDAGGTAVAQQTPSLLGPNSWEAANMSTNMSQAAPNMSVEPFSQTPNMNTGFGQGATNMLSDPSSVLSSDATGNKFVTDWDMYKNYAQQGFRALNKGIKALPAGTVPMVAKSLIDQPQPKQEQIMARPPGGGAPSQQPSSVSLLGQQQPHQISPYAPIFAGAGGDDAEMQRRRKLMLQQMGYA